MSNLESIFHAAVLLPHSERARYLDSACADDTALRAEIESLLAADDKASTFMAGLENQLSSVLKHHQETGTEIGRYRIDKKIASGGMGSVYQAWDSRLNRDVALKFLHPHCALDPNAKQRFMREAHAVSKLNHPNICTVHDVADTETGEQYIVMELCIGRRLDELLAENTLSYEEIFKIATQLCTALSAAHDENILHRDLKPQNVIVDETLHVKLLDFGIAKVVGAEASATSQALGTVAYMAPEQFNAGAQDKRTDVWALGTLFFELLTGSTPFVGNTQPEVMRAIFEQRRMSLSSAADAFPIVFEDFFDACLAHRIDNRLASMQAFQEQLVGLKSHVSMDGKLANKPTYVSGTREGKTNSNSTRNERRNVTIVHLRALFPPEIDPEERASASDHIKEIFQKIVRRFGAHQFSNSVSELAAYFGYPKADEHSTVQAVRCALALKEAISRRQVPDSDTNYASQIAVHTDLMIARNTDTSAGVELVGDGPAVAQNLSFNAAPNQILVSPVTAELVQGFFSVNNFKTNTGQVAEVLRESSARSKFDVSLASGLSPLAGRVHELGMLSEAWQQAQEGEGRVIAISGDPGIGKSRLIHELKKEVAKSADAWLVECQSSPYQSDSVLYPVTNYLKTEMLQFTPELSAEEKQSRVIGLLTEYGFDEEEIGIFAELLETPVHMGSQSLVSPDQRHTAIFSGLEQILKQRANNQPVLAIFEDLHWADASTNKLIEYLLQQALPNNLLLMLTFRPNYKPRWLTTEAVTHLVVQRLSKKDSRALIETLYGENEINPGIQAQLMEKTDGNPLFIETITQAVVEHGLPSIDAIPASLHDSLASRLDQLGSIKQVAQHAAVIGREFTFSLLKESLEIEENILESSLKQLSETQLVTTPSDKLGKYRFKHALIRDAAYDSLLKRDKSTIHGKIAKILLADPNVGQVLLANHCDLAGLYEEAASAWLNAAKSALNQAAAREAFGLCEKGLAAIDKASPNESLSRIKIDLLLTLGPSVIATRGYTDHRLAKTYSEAFAISESLGTSNQSFTALFGTFTFNIVNANHKNAYDTTQKLLSIAHAANDAELIAEADMASGLANFFIGDFLSAKDFFSKTVEIYSPEIHGRHAVSFGQDPKMIALAHLGWIQFILGEGAPTETSAAAIMHARELRHPFSLTYALTYDGATQLYSGNIEQSRLSLNEAIAISREYRIHGVELLARVFSAMIEVFATPCEDTIFAAERVIENYKSSSANMFLTAWSAELGLAYLAQGKLDDAKKRLKQARQYMQEFGERWYQFPILCAEAILANHTSNPETAVQRRKEAAELLKESGSRGWLSQRRFETDSLSS